MKKFGSAFKKNPPDKASKKSTPSVFVIESLSEENEKEDCFEGSFLRSFLRLSGKDVDYIYIRTARELEHALNLFQASNKRYLHLSCHANKNEIGLTLDSLSLADFARYAAPYLNNRRLFLSACEVTTLKLAREIFAEQSGCHSIIGFGDSPDIRDAALMWTTFYHEIFKDDPDKMSRVRINGVLESLAKFFKVKLQHYYPKPEEQVTRVTFGPTGKKQPKSYKL